MTPVNPELLERLRFYQSSIDWRDPWLYGRAEMVRDEARYHRIARDERRELDRAEWPKKQAAKRNRGLAIYRGILMRRPCAYCGGVAATIDHIMPRCRGGLDVPRNLAPACRRCNSEKGRRTPEEWKTQRLHRGRSWPPRRALVLAVAS